MTENAPSLNRVLALRLTTSDPERLLAFYTEGIGCALGQSSAISSAEMTSLGLAGGVVRRSLKLGEERIDIDTFEVPGASYPMEKNAADLVFQHFAIVVTDVAEAYRRVVSLGAIPSPKAPR